MYLYDNSAMALGDRLRKARKDRKMSQEVLSKKVGVSQGLISDLENNVYPTSSYVPKIADVLEISAIWLADGKGEMELEKKPADKTKKQLVIAGTIIETREQMIVDMFLELSEESKNAIEAVINRLHSLENKNNKKSDPFRNIPKTTIKEKQ